MTDSTWFHLNPNDPRHGTIHGYTNLGCSCDRCRAANTAEQQRQRATRKAAKIPAHVHGTTNGYDNYGCRKACCRAAHNKSAREKRAARKVRGN